VIIHTGFTAIHFSG